MTAALRQLRLNYTVALLLFVGGMVALTGYTLKTGYDDALYQGFDSAERHARAFEDTMTQSLLTTVHLTATILNHEAPQHDLRHTEETFSALLKQAPFLRSISLLDEHDKVTASTNPHNVGLILFTNSYLPTARPDDETVRIGEPWLGRDFAGGKPANAKIPVKADDLYFIPVAQTLRINRRKITLLIAYNPDYFINHFTQRLPVEQGRVEILRYDGTLLLTSDPALQPGTVLDRTIQSIHGSGNESGRLAEDAEALKALSAFRASRLYPLLIVARVQRDFALTRWRGESTTLLASVIPAVLSVVLLTLIYLKRQLQRIAERTEFERLQHINATVFDSSQEATLITDIDGNIVSINAAFTRATGFMANAIIGHHLFELLTDNAIATYKGRLPQRPGHHTRGSPSGDDSAASDMERIEVELRCSNGAVLWMEILSTPVLDPHGDLAGYRRIARNITERRQSEEKIRLAASVFTHTREGICITDSNGVIIDVNDAFCQITGYSREEAINNTPRMLKSNRHGRAFYSTLWREVTENGYWHGEIWNQRKNGEMLAEMLTISAVCDATGKPRNYVALFSDITAIKEHEQELEHIAHFDALTGLPNRVLLADRLNQAMTQEHRRGLRLAVAFLDLDGFKAVNDDHGHDIGDKLLITIANRMKLALREGDTLARLGGDEFVAVLLDLSDVPAIRPTLTRLLDAAAQPVLIGELELHVSASLGVTFYPQEEELGADQLLRQADQAMYQAKLAGKNRFSVFRPETKGPGINYRALTAGATGESA